MNGKKVNEIRALVTLLGDDDFSINELARKKLLQHGDSAKQILQQVAFSDSEGRVRIEAQSLLEEFRLDDLAKKFKKVNSTSNFNLEHACFILAQIEYPDVKPSHYSAKIDQLAIKADKRLLGVNDEKTRVKLVNHFLFREEGFRGNVKSYYDPKNSYINKVLDRHLGIPISLSAIYLFLAERLHLPVTGVGMPGHFLLKYNNDSEQFFIDAFNQGQILSRKDCEIFLHRMGFPFFDFYLSPTEPRDILARMIRNLVLIYLQHNQKRKIDILEKIFSDFVMK